MLVALTHCIFDKLNVDNGISSNVLCLSLFVLRRSLIYVFSNFSLLLLKNMAHVCISLY